MAKYKKADMEPGKETMPNLEAQMDTGWAWVVLLGSFMSMMLSCGMFWSFGVLLIAWEEQLSNSVTKLQWIISLLLTSAHLSCFIGSFLCKIYSVRKVTMMGTILATISFVFASFGKLLWHLYVTFAFAGVGMGMIMQSCYVIQAYYFKKRLARANGVMHASLGVALFVIPLLTQYLIDNYGWNGALLINAGLVANCGVAAALFRSSPIEIYMRNKGRKTYKDQDEFNIEKKDTDNVKNYAMIDTKSSNFYSQGKVDKESNNANDMETYDIITNYEIESCPESVHQGKSELHYERSFEIVDTNYTTSVSQETNSTTKKQSKTVFNTTMNLGFLRDHKCQAVLLSYFFFTFGFTLFMNFSPARAASTGLTSYKAAYLVSAMGITSCFSRLTHGYILDYKLMSVTSLAVITNFVCAICGFLNPLNNHFGYLVTISSMFGLMSGTFNSLHPIIFKKLVGLENISEAVASVLFSYGLGILISSYGTGVLVDLTHSYTIPFYLAGMFFLISASLILAIPLANYINKRTDKKDDMTERTQNTTSYGQMNLENT